MHFVTLLALGTLGYFIWFTFDISDHTADFRLFAKRYGNWTGGFFVALSVTLLIAYVYLLCALRRYQENTSKIR